MKETILRLAKKKKRFKTADVVNEFKKKVSRQYVAKMIGELVGEGKLLKGGSTFKSVYVLPENAAFLGESLKKHYLNKNLKEHEVLGQLENRAPFILKQKENVRSIFAYAFSEMLNNAIEHSRSNVIDIEVNKTDNHLNFTVEDSGIGVFRNIMSKRRLSTELEAIQDLLRGKVTTLPQAHTGEGIFFTSKIADVFVLESFAYRLRIDNIINDIFIEPLDRQVRGTVVKFSIGADTKKHLNDVFKKYQTDPESYAFDKTEVKVKLYTMGTIYISRSQARRVLHDLEKFKMVIFDFERVPTIGQAFADEIFRVFALKHPEIKIKAVNMNETVGFMVKRTERPKNVEI